MKGVGVSLFSGMEKHLSCWWKGEGEGRGWQLRIHESQQRESPCNLRKDYGKIRWVAYSVVWVYDQPEKSTTNKSAEYKRRLNKLGYCMSCSPGKVKRPWCYHPAACCFSFEKWYSRRPKSVIWWGLFLLWVVNEWNWKTEDAHK